MSEPADGRSQSAQWFVYILRCGNGAFYTGVTTDVERRFGEHEAGGRLSARYTRAFAPVTLVYSCRIGARRLAHRVEYRIKRLPHQKKSALVVGQPDRSALLALLSLVGGLRDGESPAK